MGFFFDRFGKLFTKMLHFYGYDSLKLSLLIDERLKNGKQKSLPRWGRQRGREYVSAQYNKMPQLCSSKTGRRGRRPLRACAIFYA